MVKLSKTFCCMCQTRICLKNMYMLNYGTINPTEVLIDEINSVIATQFRF